MVCCRDPDFDNGGHEEEGEEDYFDFDKVFEYPYRPHMEDM